MTAKIVKAFIDQQEIKIVNEEGYEFLTLISDAQNSAKNIGYVSLLFLFLFLIFTATLISQFILPNFSEGKNLFLVLGSLINCAASAICFGVKCSSVSIANFYIAEYNNSKEYLQPVILQLEKTLRIHKAELLNIDNVNKFNFKKSAMEMTG